MTEKFIKNNCVNCDNCIWGTPMGLIIISCGVDPTIPIGCGIIDDEGGNYIEFDDLENCPKQS